MDLLKEISFTLTKTKAGKISAIAVKENYSISELIDLTFHKDDAIAFRAAWILEYIEVYFPARFLPHFESFNKIYSNQKNHSCQRHFTKIMMHFTSKKAPEIYQNALRDIDLESIVETTFSWLIDSKTPVAVKVNCLDILFDLSDKFDWIKDELKAQTEFLLRDGSAAMQSRGRKILGRLEN
ncbi:hypothetical protein GS399_14090 [Pedobacter sp. HMF7647]|uniref:Adenylosuccinate lyase n=1 Tax=Hufsiella arboris TaxID=2695275 RepID=A0A7K1YC06_9SPHI|nr:hypothetical protein [Hufsiella arboris]MXV52105.1 hypothetical protein [Hufsiella arboris]